MPRGRPRRMPTRTFHRFNGVEFMPVNSCTYCKGRKCGFKEMVDCKIKMALDENKNLEAKLKEYIKADLEHDAQNSNWERVFKPIREIDTTKDAGSLPMDCLIAIQESQELYKELFEQ